VREVTPRPPAHSSRHAALVRRRRWTVAAVVVAVLVVLYLALARPALDRAAGTANPDPAAPTLSAAPPPPTPGKGPGPLSLAPAAVIDTATAPAPGMDPQFAPPDGPAPDWPPFDVDAVAMREELRTHGVDLPDARLYQLVQVADKYIAQGDPDLDAWDPRIMRDVRTLWPDVPRKVQIAVTRCLAEYVERVIARNNGWPHPPDEDDHNVAVSGVPGGPGKPR
jgi:hypothetical protein